ncbi:MAG: hypothetical protein ACI8ZA_002199, partial [Gammaproteobacteria bacterium]
KGLNKCNFYLSFAQNYLTEHVIIFFANNALIMPV